MPRMDNTVELLGYYGSDEVIACSAWTSTNRNLTEEKKSRIGKLIGTLWTAGHETPFEKGMVHFLVNTSIDAHIHLLKHRISSLNGESARYKELTEDKYYIPEDWEGIKQSDDEYPEHQATWAERLEEYTIMGNKLYHQCFADLEPVLGRKRAKESARFFKGYNSQIQADISFNMRSFANFIKLRRSGQAQLEIRKVADDMLNLVINLDNQPFKHTIEAWKKSGVIKNEDT